MLPIANVTEIDSIFHHRSQYYIVTAVFGGKMKKRKRKDLGLTALMLMGAGFALALIIAMAFIISLISSFTSDPTAMTGALSLVALLLAGATAGFVSSRVNGDGGALVGILSAVISASVILTVGLIARAGRLSIGVFINALAYIAVSALASILGKKRVKRRKRRYA